MERVLAPCQERRFLRGLYRNLRVEALVSDGNWLEVDEVGFEHHPDLADWMHERGCGRARVVSAAQVEGNRWTLLECFPGEPDDPEPSPSSGFRALALGDEALAESEDPAWLEALERFGGGSQSRS